MVCTIFYLYLLYYNIVLYGCVVSLYLQTSGSLSGTSFHGVLEKSGSQSSEAGTSSSLSRGKHHNDIYILIQIIIIVCLSGLSSNPVNAFMCP